MSGVFMGQAQTPAVIDYTGRVVVDGTNFNSTPAARGYFKCILLTRDGGTNTIWSSDGSPGQPFGSSRNGEEPSGMPGTPAAIELTKSSESAPFVVSGLFRLRLGDSAITPPINASTLSDASGQVRGDVYLRVWFSADNDEFEQLGPDVKLVSAPYAVWASQAEAVKKGGITPEQLRDGGIGSAFLNPGYDANAVIEDPSHPGQFIPDPIRTNPDKALQIRSEHLADRSVSESKLQDNSISGSKIQAGAVSLTNLAPKAVGASVGEGGIAISDGHSLILTQATEDPAEYSEFAVELRTVNRPVLISFMPGTNEIASTLTRVAYVGVANTNSAGVVFLHVSLRCDGREVAAQYLRSDHVGGQIRVMEVPPSSFQWVDFPGPGLHRYSVWIRLGGAQGDGARAELWNVRLMAREL